MFSPVQNWLSTFFSSSGFMPHIHCYLDSPPLVWTMFTTDMMIGIAYVAISITLWALVRKIKIPFNFVVICFGVFILACGLTHFMEVWTLWHPDYWWAASFKFITALASVGTGIYLFRLRHSLVTVAEAAKLSEQHRLDLEALTTTLEQRVNERTAQFESERVNLRNLFKQTPEMVCILRGPQHVFEFVNEAHIRALGFDATGKSVREAQPESIEIHGILDQVYKTGETAELREIPITVTDRLRYFDLTYAARKDGAGNIDGIMILGVEITEQVLAREELHRALQARDEFLSVASHELRTPLTSMKMQVQLAKRHIEKGDPSAYEPLRVEKLVKQTDVQIDRIGHLVDDMLDISRIDTGKLAIHRQPMDMSALTREVVERYRNDWESANSPVTVSTSGPIVGNWDPFRIEQVVTNLLTNAIRYGNSKPIQFEAKLAGNSAELIVRDHGIGIAKENQERIFQRFERAVTANEISGLGLGLYIVRQILEMHRGSISVESEVGQGTTFTVKLPLSEPVAQNAT
jgi:signal transduction histidine kinase